MLVILLYTKLYSAIKFEFLIHPFSIFEFFIKIETLFKNNLFCYFIYFKS